MEIQSSDEGWVFSEMDPFIAELFRILPASAAPDDDASRKRIFSAPTRGRDAAAANLNRDWSEYVEPELRELFKTHVDIVAADLALMKGEEESLTLRIPAKNARAWIHTLNQARLALGARHGVTEDDIEDRQPKNAAEGFALMQIDFYGTILSLLLSRTEL